MSTTTAAAIQQDWIGTIRQAGVAAIAAELGLEARPSRSLGPCPVCGALTRHTKTKDRRGAIGLSGDGLGWHCFQCESSGDALDLISYALHAARMRDAGREGVAAVRSWCADRGWCEPQPGIGANRPPRPVLVRPPPPLPPPAPPKRPHAEEVANLWARALPVWNDQETSAWLRSRGLDPGKVTDFDLARALPVDLELPSWARMGRPWTATGHRLIVQAWEPDGRFASLHARRIVDGDMPKTAWPKGCSASGLVFCDALARMLLTEGPPDWWKVRRLVVAEGLPDFLTFATLWSDADVDAPAVVGMTSGSWTEAVAAKVPDHCAVIIATDADKQGERYAEKIRATLAGRRVTTKRWRPPRKDAR